MEPTEGFEVLNEKDRILCGLLFYINHKNILIMKLVCYNIKNVIFFFLIGYLIGEDLI